MIFDPVHRSVVLVHQTAGGLKAAIMGQATDLNGAKSLLQNLVTRTVGIS